MGLEPQEQTRSSWQALGGPPGTLANGRDKEDKPPPPRRRLWPWQQLTYLGTEAGCHRPTCESLCLPWYLGTYLGTQVGLCTLHIDFRGVETRNGQLQVYVPT